LEEEEEEEEEETSSIVALTRHTQLAVEAGVSESFELR